MRPIAPELLGRLYREHAPALLLFARQWGEGAEDVVQAAFLKLAQQSVLPDQVLPWLYRVVRNEALAINRSAARRRRREQHVSSGEPGSPPLTINSMPATPVCCSPTCRLIARGDRRAALGRLTFEEVAKLVGLRPATAHRRYQTGLPCSKRARRPMHANDPHADDD